jgi:hypothetical protein
VANESFFANGFSPFPLDIQSVQFDQFKARTYQPKKHFHKRNLPRPEDFSKALYIVDSNWSK